MRLSTQKLLAEMQDALDCTQRRPSTVLHPPLTELAEQQQPWHLCIVPTQHAADHTSARKVCAISVSHLVTF